MSILDSLLIDAFGLAIVFLVLIVICFLIKLISVVFGSIKGKESSEAFAVQSGDNSIDAGRELELADVDEKTAALIMAIVSKNTNIPLSRLHFKSIRLVNQKG